MTSRLLKSIALSIPQVFIVARILIAVLLVLDALDRKTGIWFLIGFVIAFLFDIFDGIIARRLGVATESLRVFDSCADLALYSAVLVSIWFVQPSVFLKFSIEFWVLATTQVMSWIFCILKFRKVTAYHSYLAKAWGVCLAAGIFSIFAFQHNSILILLALVVGIFSNLEDMIITMLLPSWKNDIASINAAWKLRLSSNDGTVTA